MAVDAAGHKRETPFGPYEAIPGLRLIPIGQRWSAYFVSSPQLSHSPKASTQTSAHATGASETCSSPSTWTSTSKWSGAGPITVLDGDEFTDHVRAWGELTQK